MPKAFKSTGDPLARNDRVAVHVEPRKGVGDDTLLQRLAELGATNVEKLVPGIWTAEIDNSQIPKLQKIAGVSIMDQKFMRGR